MKDNASEVAQLNYRLWMDNHEAGSEPPQAWKDGYHAATADIASQKTPGDDGSLKFALDQMERWGAEASSRVQANRARRLKSLQESTPSHENSDTPTNEVSTQTRAPLVPPTHAATFVPSFSEAARMLGVSQAQENDPAIVHWAAIVAAYEKAARGALGQPPENADLATDPQEISRRIYAHKGFTLEAASKAFSGVKSKRNKRD